jgi:hypothetical protein
MNDTIGLLYSTKYYAFLSDYIYDKPQLILEIFIPEHNIAFNFRDNILHVFRINEKREGKPIRKVRIKKDILHALLDIRRLQDEVILSENIVKPNLEELLKFTPKDED